MYPVYEYLTVLVMLVGLTVFLFATSAVVLAAQEGAKLIGRSARARAGKASTWAVDRGLGISGVRSVSNHPKS